MKTCRPLWFRPSARRVARALVCTYLCGERDSIFVNTQEKTINRVGGRMLQMATPLCMRMLTVGHRTASQLGGGQDFFPLGLREAERPAERPADRQPDRAPVHDRFKGQGRGYSCFISLKSCFTTSPSSQCITVSDNPMIFYFLGSISRAFSTQ